MTAPLPYDIVVPTVGRPSLRGLVETLQSQRTDRCEQLVIADDRVGENPPLSMPVHGDGITVVRSGGRGPAAARNAAVRSSHAPWVVFVDDDVVLGPTWVRDLETDLDDADADVAGVQARLHVPLPSDRAPTDWERNVAGLERALWATADLAYRRQVLLSVGGFDERFAHAYREDSDLGLRVVATGARIVYGDRIIEHPVRPAPWYVSISKQSGNADDARMTALHGHEWRARAGAPGGRRPWHVATVVAGAVAAGAALGHWRRVAVAAGGCWTALTLDFARRRVIAGPKTLAECAGMLLTSTAIPPIAVASWLAGSWSARGAVAVEGPMRRRVDAVLFDRDGTLVLDVPYNDDPKAVVPKQGAQAAIARLREAGLPIAMITNQSGISRGVLDREDVDAVNARVNELLGPFDAICVCPHGPDDKCSCRKPGPGLVQQAAARLGVAPESCVVIGDIGSDVEAAHAAGALGVLVPTIETRQVEIAAAPMVAENLASAVDLVLRMRTEAA